MQIGLLVVIAAFVASLFVFGSSGSRMGGDEARDRVATVNGESIPIERFQRRYQSYLEAYAQMYRDRFTNELAERLGLPQQVVGDLVLEALIVQRAQAEGLAVTDEELNARIHSIPAFQENGRFSLKRYQDILKRRGLNPAAFEGEIRRELTRAKVESAVRGGVKVSETELEQAFRMRREEVRAAWALVELAPIVARRQRHRRGSRRVFREAPRRVPPARPSARAVRDAEPQELHADSDATPRSRSTTASTPRSSRARDQVRAAHVLVRVPETGGSEAEDKARSKIADVIRRAKAGRTSASSRSRVSEDSGTAPRGGDLGS